MPLKHLNHINLKDEFMLNKILVYNLTLITIRNQNDLCMF